MSWKDGRLTEAKVLSKLGGVLRLRSSVPLQGKNLRPAVGPCPNPLMAGAEIKNVEYDQANLHGTVAPAKVYEYDIQTKAGKSYRVEPKAF